MDDNMEFHGKTEGQYNMNFYPESEDDFERFFAAGAPHDKDSKLLLLNSPDDLQCLLELS
jgi:hypothetical protein